MVASLPDEHGADKIVRLGDELHHEVFSEPGPGGEAFNRFVAENEIPWPEFTLTNQQGNRWTQNRDVIVWPDGRAQYLERIPEIAQALVEAADAVSAHVLRAYSKGHSACPLDVVVERALALTRSSCSFTSRVYQESPTLS